ELPPGLSLDASGLISGTPISIATNRYTFMVRVADSTGATHEREFEVTITGAAVTSTPRGSAGCAANHSGATTWCFFLGLMVVVGGSLYRRRSMQ
ncbi:MAG: putative Ig domain-containing protein, partial [Planctomycetes bacterium]|nr:putative Ig domain-containing protein [Planctomycetota bacterium]